MRSDRALKGMFLIGIGVILLFYQLDFFPSHIIPHYFFSWPSLLIVIGAFLIASKPDKTGGLIVIGIGVLFLLKNIYHFNPFEYWPIFIILAGLGILLNNKKKTPASNDSEPKRYNLNELDEVNVFSGGERIITSNEFSGGTVTSIFGGSEINLLNSSLAPGINKIEVYAIFGGTTFFVPSDWKVRVEVVAIFGGFSDKRRISSIASPSYEKELVIKGFVIFGGGEIKSL